MTYQRKPSTNDFILKYLRNTFIIYLQQKPIAIEFKKKTE